MTADDFSLNGKLSSFIGAVWWVLDMCGFWMPWKELALGYVNLYLPIFASFYIKLLFSSNEAG